MHFEFEDEIVIAIENSISAGFKKDPKHLLFTRDHNDRRESIYFELEESNLPFFGLRVISVWTDFFKVENMLALAYESSPAARHGGDTGTIRKALFKVPGIDYSKLKLKIDNADAYANFVEELQKISRLGIEPFFTRYINLDSILEDSDKMEITTMANFIGQPLPPRRLIIKGLCGDPTFGEYYSQLIQYYEAEVLKGTGHAFEFLSLLRSIYDLLRKTKVEFSEN